jgi:hypothetical protein
MPAWNVHFEGISALRRVLAFSPEKLELDSFEGMVSGVQQGCKNARSTLAKNALMCVEDLFFFQPPPLKSLSSLVIATLVTTCLERCSPSQSKTIRAAATAAVEQMTAAQTELEVLALLWPALLPHAGHKNKDVALQAIVSAEKVLTTAVALDGEFVQQKVDVGQALSCLILGINGKVPAGRSAAKVCCLTLMRSIGKDSYQSSLEELTSLSQLQRDELLEAAGIVADIAASAQNEEEVEATDVGVDSKHEKLPSPTVTNDAEDLDSENSTDSETDEELMAEIAASEGTTWIDQTDKTQNKELSSEVQARPIKVAFMVTFSEQTMETFDSSVQLDFLSVTATALDVAVEQVVTNTIQAGSVIVEVSVAGLTSPDDALMIEDRASNPALLEAALALQFGACKVWSKNWLGQRRDAIEVESTTKLTSAKDAGVAELSAEATKDEAISPESKPSQKLPAFSSILGDDLEEWEKPKTTRAFVESRNSNDNARVLGASVEEVTSPSVSLSAGLKSSPIAEKVAPDSAEALAEGTAGESTIEDDVAGRVIATSKEDVPSDLKPSFSSILGDDVEEWEKPKVTRAFIDARSSNDNARELGASVEGVVSPVVSLSAGLGSPAVDGTVTGISEEAPTEATADQTAVAEVDDAVNSTGNAQEDEATPPESKPSQKLPAFSSILSDDVEEWEKPKDTRAFVDTNSNNDNARELGLSVEEIASPKVSLSAGLTMPSADQRDAIPGTATVEVLSEGEPIKTPLPNSEPVIEEKSSAPSDKSPEDADNNSPEEVSPSAVSASAPVELPSENSAGAVESQENQEEAKKEEAQRRADAYVARAKAKVEAQKLKAQQDEEAAAQAKTLQEAKDAEARAAAEEVEAAAAQLAEEERVAAEATAAEAAAAQAAAEEAAAAKAREEAAAAAEAEALAAAARAEEEAKAAAQAKAEKDAALLEASKAKTRARASPPRDDEFDASRSRNRDPLQSPSIDDPPDVRLENIRSRVASANSSADRLPTPVKGSPLPASSSSSSMSARPKGKNRRMSSTSTHGFALLQSGVGTYLAMNFEAPNAPLPVRAMTLDPDGIPVIGMLWQLMPDKTLQNRATGYILEIEGLQTGRKIPVVCGERGAGYTRKGVADAAQWSLTADNEIVNRSNGYLLTVRNGSNKTRTEVWCNYKMPLIGTTAAQRWFFRPYEGEPKAPLYPVNPKFEHLFKDQADKRFGTNI